MDKENDQKQQTAQQKQNEIPQQQIHQNGLVDHLNSQQTLSVAIQNKNRNQKSKKHETKKQLKGVEDNPEYFRVDTQTCHKIYQIYRKLKVGGSEQQRFSFDQKELGNQTMNYHKIMQMFKDIQIKLQINQKLTILRSIKKFCFNANFINQEQFTKIFKVIVHGLGLKESIFKSIIQSKYSSVPQKQQNIQKRAIDIRLNKKLGYKLKTEPIISQSKANSSPKSLEDTVKQTRTLKTIKNSLKNSIVKKLGHIAESPTSNPSHIQTANKTQLRKRIITEGKRYERMQERSYLGRALQKNKLNKVTWQSLFKMNDIASYNNICIPHFISQNLTPDDPYF